MNYVGRLAGQVLETVKELYDAINQATLSGCIDVVVVRQRDGTYQCSPFHLRFGKLGVMRSKEKVVDIEVNEEPVDLYMKLGNKGEAFFVQEAPGIVPAHLVTSPITTEDHQLWKSEVGDMEDDDLADTEEDPSEPTVQSTSTTKKKRRRKKHKGDPRLEELAPPNAANVLISATTPAPIASRQIKELIKELSSDEEDSAHASRSLWDINSRLNVARHNLDNYAFSDSECYAAERHGFLNQNSSSKSDSELLVRPLESIIRDESLMQWTWGEFPESTRVSKKERQELPKAVIITPPESIHVEAIENKALENKAMAGGPMSEDVSITTVMPISAPLMPDSSATSLSPVLPSEPLDVLPTTSTLTDSLDADHRALDMGEVCSESDVHSKKKGVPMRRQHQGPEDLDELNVLQPEDIAHLPKIQSEVVAKDWMDSGMHSGTQLHQPVGSVAVDSITECLSDSTSDLTDVAFSLCGGLSKNTEIPNETFMAHIITYTTFAENPAIMSNPNLVVRIGNKYYNWTLAAPLRPSLQALQRNLPKATEEARVKEKLQKKPGRKWMFWQTKREDSTIEKSETKLEITKEASQLGEGRPSVSEENLVLQRNQSSFLSSDEADREVSAISSQERLQPQEPPTQTRSEERQSYKSLCLTSDQITSLKLNEGQNKVTFSITTQYQGTCRLEGTIYLWNWDDKVVISDIDGTITKSDVFGHILPQLGKDWTHRGIAKLYHSVAVNGYKFLYCSARAIGMADMTRGYLKWVNDEGFTLPKGPLMLSPSSLLSAFHRDVIEKKPEIFKIECLTDIKNLFQQNKQPFYAAFGNRTNDVFAYKEVGVHEGRIFTVNPKGELIQEQTKGNKSSYSGLSELLEHVFPLLGKEQNEAFVLPEYSWFNYWRQPIPEFNPDELL